MTRHAIIKALLHRLTPRTLAPPILALSLVGTTGCMSLPDDEPITIWNATSMFDAARVLGAAVRRVYENDGPSLKNNGMDFVASFIFGGQIGNEAMRLFLIYSAGNFIEATRETCFFQIGESKYGKPILDRVLTPTTPLEEAAKCALVSMDSTLKSNLSVGLPLDLVVYEEGKLQSDQIACIDDQNPYFRMVRDSWGRRLREVFEDMDDPQWGATASTTGTPLIVDAPRYETLKKIHNETEKVV